MMYWVGTSEVNVMRSSDKARSTSSGSNDLRSWTQHAAPQNANANETYSEFAWHIGITSRHVSDSVKPMSRSVTSEIIALPSCVRTAPFDLPVVPDVYISAQMSSGRTSTCGSL